LVRGSSTASRFQGKRSSAAVFHHTRRYTFSGEGMKAIPSSILSGCMFKAFAAAVFLLTASSGLSAPAGPPGNRNIIRVVMDSNYPPYVFHNKQGQLEGIIIDQWALWEKKTGIHVEITGMDWGAAQSKMQAGEFDVIDTMFRNDKREAIYDFSKPYARIDVPLFFHEDISGIKGVDDLGGFLVAAKAGDAVIDLLKTHGVTNIVEYPSYEKLIEAVRDGKVKIFTIDRPPALYFLNRLGIQGKFRETRPLYSGEFHRAVLKGNSNLLALVEKGFDAITPAEYRTIDNSWLGTPLSSAPYVKYLGYTAVAIAVFVAGLVVWLGMLKQAVALKTHKLTKSEERLSLALNASRSGIWDWNVKTGKVFFDSNYFTLAGYEPDEFPHSYDEWEKRVHPDDIGRAREDIKAYLTGAAGSYDSEFRFKRNDDTWMWILSQGKLSERDAQGEPLRFTGMHTDITERKAAEVELRESETRLSLLSDNIPDGVVYQVDTGTDGTQRVFTYISGSVEKLHGIAKEDVLRDAMLLYEQVLEEDRPHLVELEAKAIAGMTPFRAEMRFRLPSGEIRWKLLTSAPRRLDHGHLVWDGIDIDITERNLAIEERLKLEEQLLHTQKLESLGVMAGGIAHDFNNILTTIIGNAELGLMRMKQESPGINNLRMIEQAAKQAANLAQQMLAYSGKGTFVIEHLDLNALLEEMLHLLEVSISKMATLQLNFDPDLPPVEADATQIRQIVMNLVINASEAIGDNSGVITITTGYRDCDKRYLKNITGNEGLKEGLYVFMDIADTGCGMGKDIMAKIFDPFFTTKFTGRGLGMAAVLGIVKGHKGAIKVTSEPGKGTSFRILLPASGSSAEAANLDDDTFDWRGEGTVLLVDDEKRIRDITREMLREFGFTTITAADGRDAIEKFRENPDVVFVILDLTMPHMDGEQCFHELKRINPDVKVILSSGFSEHEVTLKFAGSGLAGVIQKPYTFSELKEALQKIYGTVTSG